MSNLFVYANPVVSEPVSLNTAPTPVVTASTSSEEETDINDMNALEAIGIDTSVTPEGVDLLSADNPYGRNTIAMNPVYELYNLQSSGGTLYGHNLKAKSDWNDFHDSGTNDNLSHSYVMTASASGYFAKRKDDDASKVGHIATIGVPSFDPKSGLYLYFTDPITGQKSDPIELIEPGRTIGNSGSQMEEDFVNAKYLLRNYLKITTGDFDNDGIDEIAVYVPEQKIGSGQGTAAEIEKSGSRVEIFDLQTDSSEPDDLFINYNKSGSSKWVSSWTHAFKEDPFVSNMVSLTTGDFDQDGVDDLGLTYGYYYGPSHTQDSNAVVLFGDSNSPLTRFANVDLEYEVSDTETSKIVRAAFVSNDYNDDDVKDLILGGQLANDIAGDNLNSRFIATYTYNHEAGIFDQGIAENFDLFEYNLVNGEKSYVHDVMKDHNETFYSLPTMVANLAVFKPLGIGSESKIYLDSLIFTFENDKLKLSNTLDRNSDFNHYDGFIYNDYISNLNNVGKFYNEFEVVAGDFTGDSTESLQVVINYKDEHLTNSYSKPVFDFIFGLLFKWDSTTTVNETYDFVGETYLNAVQIKNKEVEKNGVKSYELKTYFRNKKVDESVSTTKLNTDNDTSFMSYRNEHGVRYSDPKVLAVLASAPYFKDLGSDQLSGTYMESTTGYASSKGNTFENHHGVSRGVGAYFSVDLGKSIAVGPPGAMLVESVYSAEIEASVMANLSYEYTHGREEVHTVSYETNVGEDSVVFFSIPVEYYNYDLYSPIVDESGAIIGYTRDDFTINVPHTKVTKVLSLEKYEKIAADYKGVLPQISGDILTHEVGDPTTYPVSADSFHKPIVYNGEWAGVDYSEVGSLISQEVEVTTSDAHDVTFSIGVEFSAGVGPKDLIIGAKSELETSHGVTFIGTEGNTYTGTIYNMPKEAEEFNYGYAWKMFSYIENVDGMEFPVVNYMVKDVQAPPKLPIDFEQNSEITTDEAIGFSWSYPVNSTVSGFQIYRYYEFPDGEGLYELYFVPASRVHHYTEDEDGNRIRHYQFIDDGLAAYTDYQYQIQVIRAAVPTHSIQSDIVTARTKSDIGYPTISLSGVTSEEVITYSDEVGQESDVFTRYFSLVYPDKSKGVSVSVAEHYDQPPRYQWQRLLNGKWVDLEGATRSDYMYINSGYADEGLYRCRVNVIYEDVPRGQIYYITSYSDEYEIIYSTRTPQLVDGSFNVDVADQKVSLALKSSHLNHTNTPTGSVTFRILGKDVKKKYSEDLSDPTSQYHSLASINMFDLNGDGEGPDLPDGVYEISANYNGSRVFKELAIDQVRYYVQGGSSGYFLNINDDYEYGQDIVPKLVDVKKVSNDIIVDQINENVTYKVIKEEIIEEREMVPVYWEIFGYKFLIGYEEKVRIYKQETDMTEFVDNNGVLPAIRAGEYILEAYLNGSKVADRSFEVTQKKVAIGPKSSFDGVTGDPAVVHPTDNDLALYLGTSLVGEYGDTIESLGLAINAYKTNGDKVTISSSTPPGLYELEVVASPNQTPAQKIKYDNYDITRLGSYYVITGPRYDLRVTSTPFSDENLFAGSIEVLSPVVKKAGKVFNTVTSEEETSILISSAFSSSEGVVLQAKPQTGYQLKEWHIIRYDGGNIKDEKIIPAGQTPVLNYEMTAYTTEIKAAFKVTENKLLFQAYKEAYMGTVVAKDNAIESGAYAQKGAEYTFIATPSPGYHFVEWNLTGEKTLNFPGDIDPDTGVSTTTITMGSEKTILTGIFQRDDYSLTLPSGLEAKYTVDGVEMTNSGIMSIRGDTLVTVQAKSGFDLAPDASWVVNDQVVEVNNNIYTFSIANDTVIEVGTNQNSYSVSLAVQAPDADHLNDARVRVDNSIVNITNPISVSGGRKVEFEARPAWAYVFSHWAVKENGIDVTPAGANESILTFDEIGSNLEVTAVFVKNTATHQVTVTNNDGGHLTYTVDYNGNGASDAPNNQVITSGEIITVYEGDTLHLDGQPGQDYMLRNWIIDNELVDVSNTRYTFDAVDGDHTVIARFIPMSFTYINYSAVGGVISSATANGSVFESGDIVGNGSKVILEATPLGRDMIDYWTIDGKVVKSIYNTTFVGERLIIDSLAADGQVDIVAYFKPVEMHVVTYNLNSASVRVDQDPATFMSLPLDTNQPPGIRDGAMATFTMIPDADHRIISAKVDGIEGLEQEDGSYVFKINAITGPVMVDVNAVPLYTISLAAGTNGSIDVTTSKEVGRAIEGELISLSDVLPNLDYRLDKWYVNGLEYDASVSTFTMPAADVIISADYEALPPSTINYSIFNADGGDVNGTLSAELLRKNLDGSVITSASYPENSGSIEAFKGYSDAYNAWPSTKITFNAVPAEGYSVKYWYIDGQPIMSDSSYYQVVGNSLILTLDETTLLTHEIQVQFDVTGERVAYGTMSPYGSVDSALLTNEFGEETAVSSGDILTTSGSIRFDASVHAGYEITGWYVNGSLMQSGPSTSFVYDAIAGQGILVTITIERLHYNIIYGGDYGEVKADINNLLLGDSPVSVIGDSLVTFTAIAGPGYAFDFWTVGGEKSQVTTNEIDLQVLGDLDVYAYFKEDANLEINYMTATPGGSISATNNGADFVSGGLAASNDVIVFTAHPDQVSKGDEDNYRVKSWKVGSEIIETNDLTYEFAVDRAVDVEVSFERSDFLVDYSAIGSGILNNQTQGSYRVPRDQDTTLTATPDPGYQVKAWTVNGVSIASEDTTFTIPSLISDKTVSVEFEEIPTYTVQVTTSGSGLGSVTIFVDDQEVQGDSVSILRHGQIKLIATRYDQSHAFGGWTLPQGVLHEDNGLEIILTDVMNDMTIDAAFNPAVMIELSASENDEHGSLDLANVQVGYPPNDYNTVDLSGASVQVVVGMDAMISALPDLDYMVKSWIVNGLILDEISNELSLKALDSDTHISVEFEEVLTFALPLDGELYTVSVDERLPNDVGEQSRIRDRGTATFTFKPKTGYYFSTLTVEGVNVLGGGSKNEGVNQVSSLVNSDGSVTVKMTNVRQEIVYEVITSQPTVTIMATSNGSINVTDAQGQTVTSGQTVPVGTRLSLRANPASGYNFSSWGNSVSGSSASMAYTVPSRNVFISANFSQQSSGGSETGGSTPTFVPSGPTTSPELEVSEVLVELETGSEALDEFRTFQIQAELTNSSADILYESLDVTVARVNEDGLIRAIGFGSTEIKVSVDGTSLSATIPVDVLLVGDEEDTPLGELTNLKTASNADELVNNLIDEFATTLESKSLEDAIALLNLLAGYVNDVMQNDNINSDKARALVQNFIEKAFNPVAVKVGDDKDKLTARLAFERSYLAMNRLILKVASLEGDDFEGAIKLSKEVHDEITEVLSGYEHKSNIQAYVKIVMTSDKITLTSEQVTMLLDAGVGLQVTKDHVSISITAKELKAYTDGLEFTVRDLSSAEKAALEMKSNMKDLVLVDITVTSGGEIINDRIKILLSVEEASMLLKDQLMVGLHEEGKWKKLSYDMTDNQLSSWAPHFSVYSLAVYSPNFDDIEDNWAKTYITSLAARGIVSGYSDTEFNPNGIITRAEFTSMLMNYLALGDEVKQNFDDVSKDDWYYEQVGRAGLHSIVAGVESGMFRPNDAITREEMATMLVRAYKVKHGFKLVGDEHAFVDANNISSYAVASIYAAKATGIISGYPDNTFKPKANASRAEASAMMFLFLEK